MKTTFEKNSPVTLTALRMMKKHAAELLWHLPLQLLSRVPLYVCLFFTARALLAAKPDMTGAAVFGALSLLLFLLVVLPARFVFGEALRLMADEEEDCTSEKPDLRREIRFLPYKFARWPLYIKCSLKRALGGLPALPWAILMAAVILYVRFLLGDTLPYNEAGHIVRGIAKWLLGGDAGSKVLNTAGIALRLAGVFLCWLFALLGWQRYHGAEYLVPDWEKQRPIGGTSRVYTAVTNALYCLVSLLPAAYAVYRYYVPFFADAEDIYGLLQALFDVLFNDVSAGMILQAALCLLLVWLPVRLLRRTRAAVSVSREEERLRNAT